MRDFFPVVNFDLGLQESDFSFEHAQLRVEVGQLARAAHVERVEELGDALDRA